MISNKIVCYETLTTGKNNDYDGYKELARFFIDMLAQDYLECCQYIFSHKYAYNYNEEHFTEYISPFNKEKYYIERFVEKDSRYDALSYGLVHRDVMLKKLEEIRRLYRLEKEDNYKRKEDN